MTLVSHSEYVTFTLKSRTVEAQPISPVLLECAVGLPLSHMLDRNPWASCSTADSFGNEQVQSQVIMQLFYLSIYFPTQA